MDMMISFLVIILEFWLVMDYGYDGNVGIVVRKLIIVFVLLFLFSFVLINEWFMMVLLDDKGFI